MPVRVRGPHSWRGDPCRVPPALPLDSAPRLSQDHPRRLWPPPASQGLALVPLSGWTVSPALRSSGAALTAGGHRIGFGTCRSSVGLWSFPWTPVTASPHSFGGIPPTRRVRGWLRGAARRQADRVTGSGWLGLEGALCALHSGLVVRTHSDRKEVPFCQSLGTTQCREVDVLCLLFFSSAPVPRSLRAPG